MSKFDILLGAYKYAKKGGIIPSETSSGQLSMLPHNYGTIPTPKPATAKQIHSAVVSGAAKSLGSKRGGSVQPKPPFSDGKKAVGSAKQRSKLLARKQELRQKQYNKYKQQQLSEFGISRHTMSRGYSPMQGVNGRPAPGKLYKSAPKGRRIGPNTASEAKVDDLFGKAW